MAEGGCGWLREWLRVAAAVAEGAWDRAEQNGHLGKPAVGKRKRFVHVAECAS